MRSVARVAGVALAAVVLVGMAGRAFAQSSITENDIKRLEFNLNDAKADLARVKSHDPAAAAKFQTELDGLSDDVTYLRVKLSREGSVERSEYEATRNKIDDLRMRMESDAPRAAGSAVTIAVGTEFDVRLQKELSSGTAAVEDRFEATTLVDLTRDGRIVIPAGSVMRGVVSAVDKAGRADRKGSLTLSFDRITVHGRAYDIKGTVTQAMEGSTGNEVKKVGGGAAAGAIIGALLGGGKGALIGAMIGGGGMVAATPGSDVTLPVGTILRVRLDTPLTLR